MLHELSLIGGQTEYRRMRGWPLSSSSVRLFYTIVSRSILTPFISSRER